MASSLDDHTSNRLETAENFVTAHIASALQGCCHRGCIGTCRWRQPPGIGCGICFRCCHSIGCCIRRCRSNSIYQQHCRFKKQRRDVYVMPFSRTTSIGDESCNLSRHTPQRCFLWHSAAQQAAAATAAAVARATATVASTAQAAGAMAAAESASTAASAAASTASASTIRMLSRLIAALGM
jgi:hypothetical protein